MKNVIATWSGGKDSTLATYRAMKAGYTVTHLANTISKEYRRVRFHGVTAALIQTQADAVGIPLLQEETTAANYEEEFKENIKKGLTPETKGIVFGDIHLEDCLAWAEKVSSDLTVSAIEPLWHMQQKTVLREFIDVGFNALIVSTQSNLLGREWIGRNIDKSFVEDIAKLPGIDPCGENGEFHSFVYDGPIFAKRIDITRSAPVRRGGYWFLDIQEYQTVSKR